jgi:hypothetical protein
MTGWGACAFSAISDTPDLTTRSPGRVPGLFFGAQGSLCSRPTTSPTDHEAPVLALSRSSAPCGLEARIDATRRSSKLFDNEALIKAREAKLIS